MSQTPITEQDVLAKLNTAAETLSTGVTQLLAKADGEIALVATHEASADPHGLSDPSSPFRTKIQEVVEEETGKSTTIQNLAQTVADQGVTYAALKQTAATQSSQLSTVRQTVAGQTTTIENLETTLTTAETGLTKLKDDLESGAIGGGSGGTPVSVPDITGPDTLAIGFANVFTLHATTGLSGGKIVQFIVQFAGASQTVNADGTTGTGTVSLIPDAQTTAGTSLTISVRAKDSYGYVSKAATKTVTAVRSAVQNPTLTAPTAGAYVSPGSVTFTTSSFATIGATDTHAASRFKLTTDAAGNNVVYDSGRNTTDKLTHTAAFTATLTPGATYYAFAQHEGSVLGVSGWSAPVAVVASSVQTPTILSPSASASINPSNVTITTSAFACAGGVTDTHASTDWRITSDAEGNTVIAEALASTDLTSHVFASPAVTRGQTYYLWARHRGTACGAGEWAKVQVSIKTTRHGEILYDTSGQPAAVITGSYASRGAEPWNIRGKQVWIAVALASKRGVSKPWCTGTSSSSTGYGVDITTIENPGTNWKLAPNNTAADGSGSYVSTQSTEAHMDQSFTYSQTVKDSEGLTDAILAYNSGMQAAQYCRTITLADLGTMDLPSIDVLMRIYQARTIIDGLDTTAAANTTKKLSNWGFGSANGAYVWSASESSSYGAWNVYSNGDLSSNLKYNQFGVVPALEIPA